MFEAKAIRISVLYGLLVEKFNILLESLLCYLIPKRYGQWDSGNWSSKWTLVPCHIHVTTYDSTIHRMFVACVILLEGMFPCFNLIPGDCNLATTIVLLNFSQLHKTLIPGKLWLKFRIFSDWNEVNAELLTQVGLGGPSSPSVSRAGKWKREIKEKKLEFQSRNY